jgi:hypothetical protein
MTAGVALPTSEIDLFSDEHLDDPYPDYAALRDAGPCHCRGSTSRPHPYARAIRGGQLGLPVGTREPQRPATAATGTVIATDLPYHPPAAGAQRAPPPRQVRDDSRHRRPSGPIVDELVGRPSMP